MIWFLTFTFQGLWHFVGVTMLIGSVLSGLADIARALRGKAKRAPRNQEQGSTDV